MRRHGVRLLARQPHQFRIDSQRTETVVAAIPGNHGSSCRRVDCHVGLREVLIKRWLFRRSFAGACGECCARDDEAKAEQIGRAFHLFRVSGWRFSESVTVRAVSATFYALTLLSANDRTARRAINPAIMRIAAKPTGTFRNGKIKIKKQAKPIPPHSCGKN